MVLFAVMCYFSVEKYESIIFGDLIFWWPQNPLFSFFRSLSYPSFLEPTKAQTMQTFSQPFRHYCEGIFQKPFQFRLSVIIYTIILEHHQSYRQQIHSSRLKFNQRKQYRLYLVNIYIFFYSIVISTKQIFRCSGPVNAFKK